MGEIVTAVAQPVPGSTGDEQLTERLRQFAREALGVVKTPRRFIFREDLPREPTGKMMKRKLIDEYSAPKRRAMLETGGQSEHLKSRHPMTAKTLDAMVAFRSRHNFPRIRSKSAHWAPANWPIRTGWNWKADDEGAPASLVCKIASADDASRQIANSWSLYEREVRFYRELAPSALCRKHPGSMHPAWPRTAPSC